MNDLSFLKQIPDPLSTENEPPSHGGGLPPSDGAPTRAVTRRRRLAGIALGLAWLCTHLAIYGVRQDFTQLPRDYLVAQVVLPVVFGASCLAVAIAPGKLGLGLGIGVVAGMALLGPLSFWLLALGMPMPHAPHGAPFGFWPGALLCMDITLSWAAAPLLLVALSLRRAFPSQAVSRSALVGAAIGLLSGGAINLHCPNVNPTHLLAGHGVPVLVAAVLGAVVVARWTRA